ncbi:ABC-type multidrug transport system fused ATPase/permease subunit [Parabacteroides sp. PFB2-10]|uniref:ABC transporter permease n=1 Tax=Parabacteroides sp. PFB2-10 TaxID=1742405 RepID=UPI002475DEC4|nr:FtsX-like permease family protein [Parabacteroides sp. PFB2-10]MDH6312969.1 ABC-type multidrug transport system fused ATPase/permease subunit [Parabacteroides sp. PFB2-10]
MILLHYIKVAWRNLLRYKTQSIISIVGLAVGFACFVLASIWIRYELTYDAFHQDAERIYMVRQFSGHHSSGVSQQTPYPLAEYLRNNFPEVETSGNCRYSEYSYNHNNEELTPFCFVTNKQFLQIFPMQILKGTDDFLIEKSDNIAITEQFAKRLFPHEDPLGKTLLTGGNNEKTIVAILKDWPGHSNMPFETVMSDRLLAEWGFMAWYTFIKIKEGVDVEAFREKLEQLEIHYAEGSVYKDLLITPINKIRYEKPIRETSFHFNHLVWFAIAGGLLVICALFNYLNLFLIRINIRSRELGLRKVCGSSNLNLLWLFSVEYFLTLFGAIFIGMICIEILFPLFKDVSEITANRFSIYLEALTYSILLSLVFFLVSLIPIYYFRKTSLDQMMKGGRKGRGKRSFQQIGILCQLIISIGIIFCSVVLMKQIHHLRTVEMGIARENRAVARVYPGLEAFTDQLKQKPCITEVYAGKEPPLLPVTANISMSISQWEGKQEAAPNVTFHLYDCSRAYFDFYGFKLIAGSIPDDGDAQHVLINETAVKAMRLENPVGKMIEWDSGKIIAGVIQDFFIASPTEPIYSMLFGFDTSYGGPSSFSVLFQYAPGSWKECKQQIGDIIAANPTIQSFSITNMEEEYDKMLASENALIRILDFISVICILISLFGLFSLVTLDCEKRRKEIAIRKVNGADIQTIFGMIWKKYMLLLCLAMGIAFPIGYLIMKRWIESYVMQASIDWWIYVAIALFMALTILLCVGWRIYKAARTNPAETIKTE